MSNLNESALASRPLRGVRVLESSSFLTGPYASMMLADLGAQVIKVEPPGGDGFRSFGHRKSGWSALWSSSNRGKRSIVVDLKSEEGLATMKKLIRQADILVENWRPHVAGNLGLGQNVVREINPRVIRLSITGFGPSGPLAGAPAFDSLIQGMTGMASKSHVSGEMEITPYSVVDKVVSCFGTQSILAALYQRERTGQGCDISLPMIDVMAYFNFPDLFQHRTFKDDVAEEISPYRPVVRTADGFIIVTPVSGAQYSRVWKALERPDIKAEMLAIEDPNKMTATFYKRIGEIMVTKPSAHWLELFERHDIPAAPVLTRDEHLLHPQVSHNSLYHEVKGRFGSMRVVRYPAAFDGQPFVPESGPPDIDQHADSVRAEISAA